MNKPRVPVNSYAFDGPMAYDDSDDLPVYAPNSEGRPFSDLTGPVEDSWEADGEFTREAYTLRPDDGDFKQAGTMVREVWDDAARERFVETVAGHLLGGVKGDVLERAFLYWKNVDAETGKRIEELARAGNGQPNPGTETTQAKAEANS